MNSSENLDGYTDIINALRIENAELLKQAASDNSHLAAVALGEVRHIQTELLSKIEQLEHDVEVARMQLVACSVAAGSNTEESKVHRIDRDNPYWSTTYQAVCECVDREIVLRERSANCKRESEQLMKTISALRSSQSRHQIEMQMILDIIEGDSDFMPMEMDYWITAHDKVRALVTELNELRSKEQR